jgi:hypothetical protein
MPSRKTNLSPWVKGWDNGYSTGFGLLLGHESVVEESTMSDEPGTPSPKEEDLVACQVCLTEIPLSVAKSQEAEEYTLHFCGIECYDKWKAAQEDREE